MNYRLRVAKLELYSTGTPYQAPQLRVRDLGTAIFWFAIVDYRSLNPEAHEDAKQFLYPQTLEWQRQYDWAMAMADGVNPAWLREVLDKYKSEWDTQRALRKGEVHEDRKCS